MRVSGSDLYDTIPQSLIGNGSCGNNHQQTNSSDMKFLTLAFAIASLPIVSGHGYVTSPRGRPWRANEDGASCKGNKNNCNIADGTPIMENCPHCLNRKEVSGVCGKTNTQSYENGSFLDANGNEMPWWSEEDISQGGDMTITTVSVTGLAV